MLDLRAILLLRIRMLLKAPLDVAQNFIKSVNDVIKMEAPGKGLSRIQCYWLSFCISAIILTNSVCWSRFEKISLGRFQSSSLSWMFKRGKICWEHLLVFSVRVLLQKYGRHEGTLVLDDSDRARSKRTTGIAYTHKQKDKKTGGYVIGQNVVLLLLVTPKITLPVGFTFYQPDPVKKAWAKENNRLQSIGILKKDRPKEPPRNPDYPTKQDLAVSLLKRFRADFADIKVQCVLADALYSDKKFMDQASYCFGGVQVISQLKNNQIIRIKGHEKSLTAYFKSNSGVQKRLAIRGGESKSVYMGGARLWVKAHETKRYVIALRYEGEQEDRYIVATDMTWRMTDIVSAYTMRWLVEVFFSDWKQYEGWCQMARQPGIDGSNRGLILSLLTDYALLLHPEQKALLKHNLPALTVGSLRDHICFDAIIIFIQQIINSENPATTLQECQQQIKNVLPLASSKKHLNHRILGRLEPTPSLKYRKAG
jgi:DDE superfamily endonuclease